MNTFTKIDPLTSDNYRTWMIQIRALLQGNDLWEYVSGEIPQPPRSDAKYADWAKMDGRAVSDILLAISPSELASLDGLETSKVIWEKLKSTYQPSATAQKASLVRKLVSIKMQEEDDLKKHISDFFNVVKTLKESGLVVTDELLAILLLHSLPDSFATFQIAMESKDNLPDTEVLKAKIFEEFEIQKSKILDRGVDDDDDDDDISEEKIVPIGVNKNWTWCIDSASTYNVCKEKKLLKKFWGRNFDLILSNSHKTKVTGIGDVDIVVARGNEARAIELKQVYLVPDSKLNLISVANMTDEGFEVRFRKTDAIVIDSNKQIHMRADRFKNLYYVRMSTNSVNNAERFMKSIDKWHMRLGHLNECDLKYMSKNNLVRGLVITENEKLSRCLICESTKQTYTPFQESSSDQTNDLLHIVHSDVCGLIKRHSDNKYYCCNKYFVTFIDNFSRWSKIYFLGKKSDLLFVFQKYKLSVEQKTGKKIICFESNNDAAYVNDKFDEFLSQEGIRRIVTSQKNSVAKCYNKALIEMARCMMCQVGSTPDLWMEALNTANDIKNRCSNAALNGKIPFTLWTGKIPSVAFIQVFGLKVYYLEYSTRYVDSNSMLGILVGYDMKLKSYRINSCLTNNITITRAVKIVYESIFTHQYEEILFEGDIEDE